MTFLLQVKSIPVFTVIDILCLLAPKDLIRCRRVCKVSLFPIFPFIIKDFCSLIDEITSRPSYWAKFNLNKESYLRSVHSLAKFMPGLSSFFIGKHNDAETIGLTKLPITVLGTSAFCVLLSGLGDRDTGKTSLIYRFVTSEYPTFQQRLSFKQQNWHFALCEIHSKVQPFNVII